MLGRSALPRQIMYYAETYSSRRVSPQGIRMLTDPIAFRMQANGVKLLWQAAIPQRVSQYSCPCCIRRPRNVRPVNVTNRVTVECDVMMRVDVSLEPRQAVSPDEFLLEIPLASKLRDSFHP